MRRSGHRLPAKAFERIAPAADDGQNPKRVPRSLTQNTLSNLLGQFAVVLVAFISTPVLVGGLGMERFGFLAILWGLVGYFGFLDLGTGQAAIKYLAEVVERKDRDEARAILRAALVSNAVLGGIGTAVFIALALGGLGEMLNVRPEFQNEATLCLYLAAACVLPMLLQTALRSVPTALRRFDIVNAVQVGTGVLQWGGSAVLIGLGKGLPEILILTIVSKCASLLVYAFATERLVPGALRMTSPVTRYGVGRLVRFGAWVTPSQIIPPAVSLIERMFIGNLVALGAVTYFAIPSDTALRVLIFPVSLVNAIFPVLSEGWSIQEHRPETAGLYRRSFRLLFLLLVPVLVGGILFADDLLTIWLGNSFAEQSSVTLMILVCATFLMALAQLPNAALQALGRPDLPAKVLFIETPLTLGMSYYLTSSYGIQGTAWSVLLRCAVEVFVLFGLAEKLMRTLRIPWRMSFMWKAGGTALLAIAVATMATWKVDDALARLGIETAVWAVCVLAIWSSVMDTEDRILILRKLGLSVHRGS